MVESGWDKEENGQPGDPHHLIPGIAPGCPPLTGSWGLPPNLTAHTTFSLQKQEQKKGTDEKCENSFFFNTSPAQLKNSQA